MSSRFMQMEQSQIQSIIDVASPENRAELKAEAELAAVDLGASLQIGMLGPLEKNAFHMAVEMLVRLEAKEYRKGWWFRTKRRLQLTAIYMGG